MSGESGVKKVESKKTDVSGSGQRRIGSVRRTPFRNLFSPSKNAKAPSSVRMNNDNRPLHSLTSLRDGDISPTPLNRADSAED